MLFSKYCFKIVWYIVEYRNIFQIQTQCMSFEFFLLSSHSILNPKLHLLTFSQNSILILVKKENGEDVPEPKIYKWNNGNKYTSFWNDTVGFYYIIIISQCSHNKIIINQSILMQFSGSIYAVYLSIIWIKNKYWKLKYTQCITHISTSCKCSYISWYIPILLWKYWHF